MYRLTGGLTPTWSATVAPWGAAIPQKLSFLTELSGLVVTDTAGVYTTVNGGASWDVSPIHSKDKPRGIWMSRTYPGLGYLVAADGTILKTVTGGR